MNTKIKNLIAINIAIYTCTFGYFSDWKAGLAPGLLTVDRVLAQEPQEARSEVLVGKEVVCQSESLIIKASADSLEDKIRAVFGEDWNVAQAVAMAESRMNPQAIGDTHLDKYSYGLFQINQMFHNYSEETLLNPDENIRIAREISLKGRKWESWTTFRNLDYFKYLKQ